MGVLEDVMKALERVPGWKRIAALPKEVDELRARVEALEKRLQPATGDQCPKCREMHFMLVQSHPDPYMLELGVMRDHYQCSACGYQDQRTRT
ncbi:hypothetical protein ACO2Q2_17215 [Dyella sp. KRB-257]|uniref:hypothetical protein n=1 Tax=Dyella sp. KRB-257 TaxID=3400915 RepID=UPI003BFD04C3